MRSFTIFLFEVPTSPLADASTASISWPTYLQFAPRLDKILVPRPWITLTFSALCRSNDVIKQRAWTITASQSPCASFRNCDSVSASHERGVTPLKCQTWDSDIKWFCDQQEIWFLALPTPSILRIMFWFSGSKYFVPFPNLLAPVPRNLAQLYPFSCLS